MWFKSVLKEVQDLFWLKLIKTRIVLKKNIVILLDFHCLFKEGSWDLDVIRQFIAVLYIFKQDHITLIDIDNKVFTAIVSKIGFIDKNNISPKNSFDLASINHYDITIAHYKSEADFYSLDNKRELPNSVYFFNNKLNPNLLFPSISLYIQENKIPIDLKIINEQVQNLKEAMDNPETETAEIVLEKERISKICIICDFNQKFFIGDSCFWYYDLNQKLYILNQINSLPKNIDIYITSVQNYLDIKRIFNCSFPENVKLYNSSIKNINFESYNLVVVEYLLYLDVKILTENKKSHILTYVFPLNSEKIKKLQSISFSKQFPFSDLRKQLQYNKKYYNNIEIKNDEIDFANQWLELHGAKKEDKIFALNNAASQPEKMIDDTTLFNIIQWFVEDKNYKILLFGHDLTVQKTLKKSLNAKTYNRIIFPGKLELRKEMALMASDHVHGLLSPCTGLAHLFNGINYYLHHILGREKKKCIVYTGKQTYTSDYHPLKWWNFKDVDCISYIYINDQYLLAEKKDLLNIKNFDEVSVPTKKIPYPVLRDKIDEILIS